MRLKLRAQASLNHWIIEVEHGQTSRSHLKHRKTVTNRNWCVEVVTNMDQQRVEGLFKSCGYGRVIFPPLSTTATQHTNPPWKSLSKDEESYQSNTTSLFSSFFEIGRLRTKNNKTLIMKDLWNGVAPFEGSRNAWIVSLMSRKFRNQKSCACYSNCKNQSIAQTSGSKKKYSWLLGLFQSLGTNTIQIEDLTAATILETPHIIRDDEYLFIKTNEENP